MRRLLVANRGEVARRVFRTCRRLGIGTVAVCSAADVDSLHVADADLVVPLPGVGAEAYLDREALVDAARRTGADAVHPGYGFLAEDAGFAVAVVGAGLTFVGPPAPVIAAMADKLAARRIAAEAGLEVVPGGVVGEREWRYPVLVKAVAGGGGRGMVRAEGADGLDAAVEAAARRAAAGFGDDRVYVEEIVPGARHVEVQVLADAHGGVVHLHDRDCSVQRRHQKVIEEAPAPHLPPGLGEELAGAACRLAKTVGYVGAGTVEFLVDGGGRWWFLEMNTRLQVEHPVTEAVTGLDIVEMQIRVADGEPVPAQADVPPPTGHAIEARLLAEDVTAGDLPRTGTLLRFDVAVEDAVRVETGVAAGSTIRSDGEPLLAKVVAHGRHRAEAAAALAGALTRARVHGVPTNRDLLVRVLRHPDFLAGGTDTTWLQRVGDEVRRPLLDDGLRDRAAVAATVALAMRERDAAPVMGSIPGGFRNVPAAPARRRFDHAAGTTEVAYSLFPVLAATLDGTPVDVRPAGGATIAVGWEGVERRYDVAVYPDRVVVDAAEGSVELTEVPRLAAPERSGRPPGTDSAGTATPIAPVPGRVVAVPVRPGDRVEPGDPLVVIESMKLEHTVVATVAGRVTIVAAVGDEVGSGATVATVDPG